MTINKFWLDRPTYSLCQAAYLACGLEPQGENERHPQTVLSVAREMKKTIIEAHPDLRNRSTRDTWFEIDFVKSWADYINVTDFFNLESDQQAELDRVTGTGASGSQKVKGSPKPTANELRTLHFMSWVEKAEYKGG